MQRVSSYIYLLNAKFMNLCPLSIQWSLSSEFKWAINRRLISRTNFNFQPSVKLRLSRDLRMGDESRARGEMRKSRNHLLRLRSKSTHRARSAGNVSTQERSRFGFKILPYQHSQHKGGKSLEKYLS